MQGGSIVDHLNVFNMIIDQLGYISVKVDDQDKCMLMYCYFLDLWDHLVMIIGSSTSTFKLEDVIISLLFEEMQRKSFEMIRGP